MPPARSSRTDLTTLTNEQLIDNIAEEITPARLRAVLLALINSAMLPASDTLTTNQIRGATYQVDNLDEINTVPADMLVVGMELFVRHGVGLADLEAGLDGPARTYQLIRHSSGFLMALDDFDSPDRVLAYWVRTDGSEEDRIDSFPLFEPEDHTYYPGDVVKYTFPLTPPVTRLFEAEFTSIGFYNPVPSGLDGDANWTPFAPLLASSGGAASFSSLTGSPTDNVALAAALTALSSAIAGKQASLGYTPANKAGDSMLGDLFLAAASTGNETAPMRAVGYLEVYNLIVNLLAGWSWKNVARVATTGNIDLSAPGSVIDGVTITVVNTRVLVKNQTSPSQNGIYLWKGASTPMVRSSDANSWDELVSATLSIAEGTTNADKRYTCTADEGGTLGTNTLTWVETTSGSNYLNGTGLSLIGNIFAVLFATATEAQTGTDTAKSINSATLKAELDRRIVKAFVSLTQPVSGTTTVTMDCNSPRRRMVMDSSAVDGTLALTNLSNGVEGVIHVKNTSASDRTLTLPSGIGAELKTGTTAAQTTILCKAGVTTAIEFIYNGTETLFYFTD